MSWDYQIEIDTPIGMTTAQIQKEIGRLVDAMFLSPLFGETIKLVAHTDTYRKLTHAKKGRGEYQDNITEEIFPRDPRDGYISLDTTHEFIAKYTRDQCLMELRFSVASVRQHEIRGQSHDGTRQVTKGSLYRADGPFSLMFEGKEFHWSGLSYPPVGKTRVYIDLGNARDFRDCSQNEAPRMNIGFLLQHLSVLVNENIIGMRGLNADQSSNPGDFSLRYVRYPHVLMQDLLEQGLIQNPELAIYEESILLAVESVPDIQLYEAPVGFIIYHKDGTGGCLETFYKALASLMS